MDLTPDEKDKVSRLNPISKIVFNTLMSWMKQIIDGNCDEDSISDAASKINASTQGFTHEDDYLTLDKAMRILGFGQNRV